MMENLENWLLSNWGIDFLDVGIFSFYVACVAIAISFYYLEKTIHHLDNVIKHSKNIKDCLKKIKD